MENLNNIKDNSVIICDSVDEVKLILNLQIENLKILTSAPAVILEFKNNPKIHYMESKWDVQKIREFQKDMKYISSEIISLFKKYENFKKEDILAICQFTWLFQRKIYKYSCIRDDYLKKNIICIKHKAKINTFGYYINFDWKSLFENNVNYSEINREFNDSKWKNYNLNKTGYIKRIKIAGVEAVLYRLIQKYCKFVSKYFNFKKNIFIIADNPLIIQNSIKFFFKGYRLVVLKDCNKIIKIKNNTTFPKELFDILYTHITKYADVKISKKILEIYKKNLSQYMNEHKFRFNYFKNYLQNFKNCKNYIFNGTVSNLFVNAFSKAARELNIPVYSFQHGVTLEIVEHYYDSSIRHEGVNSSIFFTYNKEAKKITDKLEYKPTKSIIIGSSNRHNRIRSRKINLFQKNILYVSTNLYKGNLGFFYTYVNDLEQCKNEIFIIDNILKKIKYNIIYKTYPEINRRYLDSDPAILKSKQSNNITIMEEKIDIRYIIKKYNILISSGSTSTLSWLLMSNLPLIFINNKNRLPFNPELIESFKETIFYFELNEEDISIKINNLLDMPMNEILHLWNLKKQKRDLFIKNYFFSGDNKNLYNILLEEEK